MSRVLEVFCLSWVIRMKLFGSFDDIKVYMPFNTASLEF